MNNAPPEWMEKKFIPVYRRLLDGLSGRCTRSRAIRAADNLLSEEVELEDNVPDDMMAVFYRMNSALIAGERGAKVVPVVEDAEVQLDIYLVKRHPVH